MSLKLNGSASKSKTTNHDTSSSTTTPILPTWAPGLAEQIAGRVQGVAGLDPQSLVAPEHALQGQAANAAMSLGQWTKPKAAGLPSGPTDTDWLSPYMGADTPFASGGKAYDYVDRYLNPYLNDVVDSTAADLDASAGQVRAQQALDLARSGAFGGSGAALTQSMTEAELSRARASSLSGLRSHAYETALNAAAGDADRATQARISNAQIKLQDQGQKAGFGFQAQQQQLAADANQRANTSVQASLGETLRGIEQDRLLAPVTSAQQLVAMLGGLPIGLFSGEQKNTVSDGTSKTKSFTVGAQAEGKLP